MHFKQSFLGAWLVVFASLLSAQENHSYPPLTLGSPAPDFRLKGEDGRTYQLKSFARSKLLVIVFTCNHCPTAQAYEERIKQLVVDFKSKGVALLAINPNSHAAVRLDELGYADLDDTLPSMKIRAKDQQFNFPYVDDGVDQKTAKQYGPVATPHVFLFDEARKLRYQGRIDNNERESLVTHRDAREAIEELLAGKNVSVPSTKVFGCSTKWDYKAKLNRQWMEKVQAEPVRLSSASASVLKDLRANPSGKLRLINVWATWCGPCVSEFDDLIETNLRFRHRDFELITVAAQFPDQEQKVLSFLQKHHASTQNWIYGSTDSYAMAEAVDPNWNGGLPLTLLIAPNGEVLHREVGEIDFLALRRKIIPALNRITPWPGMSSAE